MITEFSAWDSSIRRMISLEEILHRDGTLVYKIHGISMEPLLRQGRDLVIISTPTSRLSKYDVALYRRGEKYVLHRVIKVLNGYYCIRGDNTFSLEKVPDSSVIGVMEAFQRRGKMYRVTNTGYMRYVVFWNAIYPLRFAWFHLIRIIKSICRKLGITQFIKKQLTQK